MNAEGGLLDVLLAAARDSPDQVIVHVDSDGAERTQTHHALLEDALHVAGGLAAAGVAAGSAVIVLPADSADFLASFWGALAAGLVPVPLAGVPETMYAVWTHLHYPPVIVDDVFEPLLLTALTGEESDDLHLLRLPSLRAARRIGAVHAPRSTDLAFLQFSSGSTGAPKGVELTHANVLANIEQARLAGAVTASDVIVSWLPYFHDMGLIGAHLTPLSVGIKQVKLDPVDFGKRPALWYETAERHRATLLPMASFALAVTVHRLRSEEVAALDLSAVRFVGVGAEPISVRMWRDFLAHMRPARLDLRALTPLYGLAEGTVAVAFPPLAELAHPIALDRKALAEGRAVDVPVLAENAAGPTEGDSEPAEFMDVGFAVAGGELRVVNEDGTPVPDSMVGHIEFRGPNVARGYHSRPEETAETFVDGWLRTGDLGFMRSGRLCVTGRVKDVLFINGQKFQAHDIEQIAASTPGAPAGRVAVVGSTDPASGAEHVAVFLPSRGSTVGELAEVLITVRARVREALAHPHVFVYPIATADFPRTTSGKIQRGRLREQIAAGTFASLHEEVARACADAVDSSTPSTRPRREVETLITDIWARVLGVPAETIGREDRFLAIGGSSLSAMQVLGELEHAFGGRLSPAVLSRCATVSALSDHVRDRDGRDDRTLTSAPTPPPRHGNDAPAVIALACRFPDADTPEAFWINLHRGRDSVTDVPNSRWSIPTGARARWGAFLEDVGGFDADYFGVNTDEAVVMDPHARIFLEVAHEALERAGYAGERRRGRRVGIFVAIGESHYPELIRQAMDNGLPPSASALTGNLRNLVAARVAHHLDLTGPAMVVDTACSSALVALHLARRSLESGECDLAVVGGVHLNLTSTTYQLLEAAHALSPTGRCHAFSAEADGFVPGEGAGALVLENLAAAHDAGDPVLAVIRGSAVNNDGRSLSLMAPNPLLQEAVITAAYADADIDPATVSYIEAHGTGTAVGDPIEARSLMRTFPAAHTPRWLGSVKTNVGHLLNAAGMPSLLKVVLALEHQQLPPSLHYAQPSPQFDLAAAGFAVVTEPCAWTGPGPLRAGINGFGFGGTNAHVILEGALEAPLLTKTTHRPEASHLLTLSAASEKALRVAVTDLASYVRAHPDLDEGDICRSASTSRDDGPHRLALAVRGDLAVGLEHAAAKTAVGVVARRRPRIVFAFPGQGSQQPGMGMALHRSQPAYRQMLEQLSEAAGSIERRSLLEWSLDTGADPTKLARTAVAQPLLVAFGISLLHQLHEWGVKPDAVLGHSVGELTAAAASGAMSPRQAVRLAVERGRCMQDSCAPGAMAAVSGPEEEVLSVIDAAGGALSLAAVNAPSRLVISGTVEAVDGALAVLAQRGCRGRRLTVSHGFHSAMMDPALQALRTAANTMAVGQHHIPFMSTVTGDWAPRFDATYLVDHARLPVQFGPAVQRLLDDGYDTFVEVGPGSTLASLVRSIGSAHSPGRHIDVFPLLEGTADRGASLVRTVGGLWMTGTPISRPEADPPRPRVPVPTYPFQRARYWIPVVAEHSSARPHPGSLSPLLHCFGWVELPLPAGSVLRSVCIVGGDGGIADALAERLIRRGVEVHRASGDSHGDSPPASVMVLLCGSPTSDATVLPEGATAMMLELCRHLNERPIPLVVVTEDVAVTGTVVERPRPGQAILAGLAIALPQENPQQAVRIVDLSSLDDASDRCDALVRELDARPLPGLAQSVAWRGGRRLTQRPLMGEVLHRDRPVALPADGRYLITGGAGGVGAVVADALARRGHPEIFLVGRSPECRPGLLQELIELGATPHYVSADVSVAADVDRLVSGLPRLDGVFHAAGLVSVVALRSARAGEVEAVLAPKVKGTLRLARALDRRDRRPDTFVLFSSVSSVLPGYAGGLGPYAAANSFLDAFAAAETAAGRPVQALNFAAWTDTGMTGGALFAAATARKGMPQLSRHQAVQALFDATSLTAPRLLVMDAAVEATADVAAPAGGDRRPARVTQPSTPTVGGRPREPMRDLLVRLIGPGIGQRPDDIDDDASFLTMGLDSLTAVDLVKKLEEELGAALPTILLFEHPSITELSAYLSSHEDAQAPAVAETVHDDPDFALTPVQTAFHTLGRLHPGLAAYACVRLTVLGALDEEILARALALLDVRHPMLRMRLRTEHGQARQVIEPPTQATWPAWFEVCNLDRPVEEVEDALCNRPFSLQAQPPIRVALLRKVDQHAHLIIVLHHLAGDGASINVVCEELWQVYTALSQGHDPELPPLRSHFRDHVRSTVQARDSETFVADTAYWEHRLQISGPTERAPLPHDGDPGADPSRPLRARQLAVSGQVTEALRRRATQLDVSLFHLVISVYARQLATWSGRREVTIDVAHAGRDARLQDINRLVGSFADTLPLTVRVAPKDDPLTLPRAVREAWLDSMRHAGVTTLDLARLLPTLDASPRTAGDAGFSFARFPLQTQPGCPVRVGATAARTASAATQLTLLCWEFEGALQFSWNYPASLFSPATIDRFSDELVSELTSVAGGPAPVPASTPTAIGIAYRIHRRCERTPDAVAVQVGDEIITYGQLDRAARRLAHHLHLEGVKPTDRVALLTERGAASVIGLLAILYSGAAWVPLDPRHPLPRLTDQATRAHTTAVVSHRATRTLAEQLNGGTVIDLDALECGQFPAHLSEAVGRPQDEAYVVFTSGTTGRPKGIPITHAALTTYLDWAISTFGYDHSDRMAATASLCFDASVRQLLAPLLVGAAVVVIPGDTLRDPQSLLTEVERHGVTVWSSVPTLWGELLRAAERRMEQTGFLPDLSAMRWIHVGGEALPPGHVRRWFDLFGSGHQIVNLYGPSEATINATYEVIDSRPDDRVVAIPIGRPVADAVIDIVGPDGRSCGLGEAGELLLSGPGLTTGYLDDPALTADVFVERVGRRYYRSGDRGLRRADGNIEFLGRTDQQVNISGHRVEPAEIEAVLHTHDGVERAVVIVEFGPTNAPRLVAYVQARASSGAPMAADAGSDLREYLAAQLPDFMVPAQVRLVDEMPLTPVGKVDPARLIAAAAHSAAPGTARVGSPLLTPTQRLLADVWRDVIGVDPVFADDDFFTLGGDSIAVLEVFARLEPHVDALPAPTALYRHRILADLASAIDAASASTAERCDDADADSAFPLTPAQRGFLLAEALSPQARSSWVSCLRVQGPLDITLFQQATDRLVARHLMLRVAIATEQRPPVQREVPAPATIWVSCQVIRPEQIAQCVAEERGYRFDSSGWPLARLRLLQLAPQEFALLVHGHHAIADGYSVVLLAQDLMAIYDGLAAGRPAELPHLRSTFREYAALIGTHADSPHAPPVFVDCSVAGPYTAPRLRRTQERSADPLRASTKSTFTLDARSSAGLSRLAAAEGATPYAAVLTAYYRALIRLTGQEDLVLGVATTGRDHALSDVTRIVGPCAHVLPIRARASGNAFRDQLRHVSAVVTAARTSGDTEHSLAATPPGAGPGDAPFFGAQFIFSYLDFRSLGPISSQSLRVAWDPDGGDLEPPPVGTDLLFTARPDHDGLQCTLRSSAGVMTAAECANLAETIRRDLLSIAGTLPSQPHRAATPRLLDAALVGYLPAPADLMNAVGMTPPEALREAIRSRIFPDGQPRLLEELSTPLGSSGFVCIPTFADELAGRGSDALSHESARAIAHASDLGARCVSLAGMIPAHTAYGLGVVRHLADGAARVSTGHATTAASVVKTVMAAIGEAHRDLGDCTVAFLGIGSIGRSSLHLLLAQAGSPKALVLCDVPSRSHHLDTLALTLAADGYPGPVTVTCSDASLAAEVYDSDVIVAALSGGQHTIDVDRLRPGTIVVDDSFPHCFDVGAARRRMARHGDILMVGGGLLTCGPVVRQLADGVLTQTQLSGVMSLRLPDTIASCQLESLLQARRPECPVVHGPVSPALAQNYWDELARTGVRAAPLHLLEHVIPAIYVRAFRRRRTAW